MSSNPYGLSDRILAKSPLELATALFNESDKWHETTHRAPLPRGDFFDWLANPAKPHRSRAFVAMAIDPFGLDPAQLPELFRPSIAPEPPAARPTTSPSSNPSPSNSNPPSPTSTPSSPNATKPTPAPPSPFGYLLTAYIRCLRASIDDHIEISEELVRLYPAEIIREDAALIKLKKMKQMGRQGDVTKSYAGMTAREGMTGLDRFLEDMLRGTEEGDMMSMFKHLLEAVENVKRRQIERQGFTRIGEFVCYDFIVDDGEEKEREKWKVLTATHARAHEGIQSLEILTIDFLGEASVNSAWGGWYTTYVPSPQLIDILKSVDQFCQLDPDALQLWLESRIPNFSTLQQGVRHPAPRTSGNLVPPSPPAPLTRPTMNAPAPPPPAATASSPASSTSSADPNATAVDLAALKAELDTLICHHIDDMCEGWRVQRLKEGKVESPVSPDQLASIKTNACAYRLTSDGRVESLRSQKDMTVEGYSSTSTGPAPFIAFWNEYTGPGPASFRDTFARANSLPEAAFDRSKDDLAFLILFFGESFLDFWITLFHNNVPIAVIYFSRFLLLCQPALWTVVSSKVSNLALHNTFAAAWKRDLAREAWTGFVENLDSTFLPDCLDDTLEIEEWEDLPLDVWINIILTIAVVAVAPGFWLVALLAGDFGRIKYDPIIGWQLWALLFLGELKRRVALAVLLHLNSDPFNEESQVAARQIAEAACEHVFGVVSGDSLAVLIERARTELQEKDSCIGAARWYAFDDKRKGEESIEEKETRIEKSREVMSRTVQRLDLTYPCFEGLPNSPERERQLARIVAERKSTLARGLGGLDTPLDISYARIGDEEWAVWFCQSPFNKNIVRAARAERGNAKKRLLKIQAAAGLIVARPRLSSAWHEERRQHSNAYSRADHSVVLTRLARLADNGNGNRLDRYFVQLVNECWGCTTTVMGNQNVAHWCDPIVRKILKKEGVDWDGTLRGRWFADGRKKQEFGWIQASDETATRMPIVMPYAFAASEFSNVLLADLPSNIHSEPTAAVLLRHHALSPFLRRIFPNPARIPSSCPGLVLWAVKTDQTPDLDGAEVEEWKLFQAIDQVLDFAVALHHSQRPSVDTGGSFQTPRLTSMLASRPPPKHFVPSKAAEVYDEIRRGGALTITTCGLSPSCDVATTILSNANPQTRLWHTVKIPNPITEVLQHHATNRGHGIRSARWQFCLDLPLLTLKRSYYATHAFGLAVGERDEAWKAAEAGRLAGAPSLLNWGDWSGWVAPV